MTRNKQKNQNGDGETVKTIAGVRFVIGPMGFVRSSEGELGHIEECEQIAAFFSDLLQIAGEIDEAGANADDDNARNDARA